MIFVVAYYCLFAAFLACVVYLLWYIWSCHRGRQAFKFWNAFSVGLMLVVFMALMYLLSRYLEENVQNIAIGISGLFCQPSQLTTLL